MGTKRKDIPAGAIGLWRVAGFIPVDLARDVYRYADEVHRGSISDVINEALRELLRKVTAPVKEAVTHWSEMRHCNHPECREARRTRKIPLGVCLAERKAR